MSKLMKAQVFHEPRQMALQLIAVPAINDNEVLIQVKACGICGSDLAYYNGRSPLETPNGLGPLVLGHELTGVVVEVGSVPQQLGLFQPGDRVVVNPAQQCNSCSSCAKGYVNLCDHQSVLGVSMDGGFAEYAKVRYTNLYKLPESISFTEGALIEPLSCATYGVDNLNINQGDFVVILGPGAIGLMMTQLVKARGAGVVVLMGIFDYPLAKGRQLGANYVFNTLDQGSPYYTDDLPGKIANLSGGELANRVIVPTNSKVALQQALEISGKRSTIVYFGLPGPNDLLEVPALKTLTMDKTLRFSWLAPFTWPKAIKALETGLVDVKDLITHQFTLEQAETGINFMDSSIQEKIKGVVVIG